MYAVRFQLGNEIQQIKNDDKLYLCVKIYGEKESSNVGKVFQQIYTYDDFQEGKFECGDGLKVI